MIKQNYINHNSRKRENLEKAQSYFANKRKPSNFNFSKKNNRLGDNNPISYLYWFLGGLAAILLLYMLGKFLSSKGVSADLIYTEGDVFLKKDKDDSWEKAEEEDKLKNYYEVKTEEGAKAIIQFDDESIIRMGEYSRIILTKEDNNLVIIQTDGIVYHRAAKNEDKKYRVELSALSGLEKTDIETDQAAFWTKKTGLEIQAGVISNQITLNQDAIDSLTVTEGEKITIQQEEKTKTSIELSDLEEDFLFWNLEQDEKKSLSLSIDIRIKLAEIKKNDQQELLKEDTGDLNEEKTPNDSDNEDINEEGKIILSAEADDEGVDLTWKLVDTEAPNGFKVLKGPNENPEYPGSFYHSVRSSSAKSHTWTVTDGETHHFRVCIVNDSAKCEVYSNDVEVETKKESTSEKKEACEDSDGDWDDDEEKCDCPTTMEFRNGECVTKESEEDEEEEEEDNEEEQAEEEEEEEEEEEVEYATSITITDGRSKDKGEATLEWKISGGEAPDGFKIVVDDKKDPVYPDDDPISITNGDTRSYTWDGGEDAEGEELYFRVCVWNAEEKECEVYSNNEAVDIDD